VTCLDAGAEAGHNDDDATDGTPDDGVAAAPEEAAGCSA
jgi:hypothetical protein